jgi:predicted SprT family Zn-dependent metalloprotease
LKYLFILALFALAVFLVYWRLRPYIRGVRRFIGVVREVKRVRAVNTATQSDIPQATKQKAAANEKLVRCAACGTWMPASRAVSLRAGATYCSHSCLERAADFPHKARKSAS